MNWAEYVNHVLRLTHSMNVDIYNSVCYGKTVLLELKIDLEPGTIPKRSKVRPLKIEGQDGWKI